MGRPLTARQQQVYDFIDQRISDRGYGPTVREIGEFLGIKSPNGVMCHLRALERKGMIHRMANKSRAIELMHRKMRAKPSLNVAGEVGQVECNLFDKPKACDVLGMLEQPDCFLLQYTGEGLDSWSIASGDILVVRTVGQEPADDASQITGPALQVIKNSRGGIELQVSRLHPRQSDAAQPIGNQSHLPPPHLASSHLNGGLPPESLSTSAWQPASLSHVRNDSPGTNCVGQLVIGVVVGLLRTQIAVRPSPQRQPTATGPMQLPLVSQPFKVCNWQ